jgi:hypothetical protein
MPICLVARSHCTLAYAALWSATLGLSACGSGDSPSTPITPVASVIAPAISEQPVDQSVPMGLAATFSVVATGTSLQYQWAKNGVAIAGAAGGSYTTPATTFADGGASFTVSVTNASGTLTSQAATLTVTARAPMAGDLRFQQVDAPSTVNGWGTAGVALSTFLESRSAQYFGQSIGTPFYIGSGGNCDVPPVTDGTGCEWPFSEFPLGGSAGSSLLVGYASDTIADFQADLETTSWPAFGNGVSPAAAASVITSLDLEPADIVFAVSWVQASQPTVFVLVQNSVAVADLQAAATEEGASSRVITAVSANSGEITYFSYGWQADTATIYEAQVVTASGADAATAAANLAARGFIITATGLADSSGNIVFVGTRVQGDTMARPFIAAQGSAEVQDLMQRGYAMVGVVAGSSVTYLGER